MTLNKGDKVWLADGRVMTIAKINNEDEAEAEDPYYRWTRAGEIAHAAMSESHEIQMVYYK